MNFIKNVKKEENKLDVIINYEIGLSRILTKDGFKMASYINGYEKVKYPLITKWREFIIKEKCPFIKTSLPRYTEQKSFQCIGWKQVISKYTKYPVELIENHSKRTGVKFSAPIFLNNILKKIFHYK